MEKASHHDASLVGLRDGDSETPESVTYNSSWNNQYEKDT